MSRLLFLLIWGDRIAAGQTKQGKKQGGLITAVVKRCYENCSAALPNLLGPWPAFPIETGHNGSEVSCHYSSGN